MLLKFESFLLQNACNIPLKIFTAPSNHGIYDHLSSYKYSMNMYLQYGSHGYNWLIVNNDKPKLLEAIVLENTIGNIETRKYRPIVFRFYEFG